MLEEIWWRTLTEVGHLEGKVLILQWILRKEDEMAVNGLIWLRIKTRGSPLNTSMKLRVH